MPYQISIPSYGEAIKEIARMVGHPVPVDPAGSADAAVQQMGSAINVALTEMLTMHEWQDLTERATIPVIQDSIGQKEKAFSLPEDFYRFIDQSQWSGSTMMPATGPVSNQAWQAYITRSYAGPLTLYWQMRGDRVWFLDPPPATTDFSFMYLSLAQVIDADNPLLLKNRASKNGDTFKLDGFMIALFGRAKYLEWKGFDGAAAMRDFLAVFNSRAGGDTGAPILSLSRQMSFPLIDPMTSVPDTGYGS